MDISYSEDDKLADLDDPLREILLSVPDQPLKLRLQPQVYTPQTKTFLSWRGVHWSVLCETIEEATALRRALITFFRLVGQIGPDGVQTVLDSAAPGVGDSPVLSEQSTDATT